MILDDAKKVFLAVDEIDDHVEAFTAIEALAKAFPEFPWERWASESFQWDHGLDGNQGYVPT